MSCFTSSAVWLMMGIPKRETCAIKPANGISANFAERAIDNSPSLNNAVASALRTPGKSMILEDLRPTIKVSGSFLFMTKTRSSCAIRNASLGLFFKPLTFTVFMGFLIGIKHRHIIRVYNIFPSAICQPKVTDIKPVTLDSIQLNFSLFGHLQGIIHLYTQITHCTFQLGMPQQQLDCT